MSASRRAALFLITITFIAFISLGSPDGLMDIANPHVRADFGIGTDVFSLIFITGFTGYFLSSFFAGQLVMRMGIGLLLSASCLATGLALLGNAIAPAWAWFVVLGLAGGGGAGAIDTGLNTYVATHYGPRLMFWLHASFGLGVTGGTWLMSVVVNSGETWRWGYAIVGLLQLTLALVFLLTRTRWTRPTEPADHAIPDQPAKKPAATPIRSTLRLPAVWLGIALFFMYAGAEVAAGRWASTLFIEGREIKPETAGLWVSAYWGLFTVGRVTAGFVGRWITPLNFIRLSMVGAVIAALVLLLNPVSWTGGIAMGVLGFMFAPIFPMLVSATPSRVGEAHVANTIGFQISAASIGATLMPGVIGVLAKSISIEVMPVLLMIVTTAIFVVHEITLRLPQTDPNHVGSISRAQPETSSAQGDR